MKIYCSCCDKVQPVRIDNCRDAKTNEPFQDIVCAECDLVIAAGTDIVPPAQQQEPVAWGIANTRPTESKPLMMVMLDEPPPSHLVIPLYATPPRQWVGLTDDEIALICAECSLRTPCDIYYARAIEAKLREKNA